MAEITKHYRITTSELKGLIVKHLATLGASNIDVNRIWYEGGVTNPFSASDVDAIYSENLPV